MSSDRELLELAAKAAGIEVDWREGVACLCHSGSPYNVAWNPRDDDGDALRLLVTLGLTVDVRPLAVCVWRGRKRFPSFGAADGETSLTGAARRAIVRAAAEIGRAIP